MARQVVGLHNNGLVIRPKGEPVPEFKTFSNEELFDKSAKLSQEAAIVRATRRTGLPQATVAEFLRHMPKELVAVPETIDLMLRLKVAGHVLYCLSNMPFVLLEHLEKSKATGGAR